jgi:hypothetical protein
MFHSDPDCESCDPELAELEELSNGTLDLIERGRFGEAERVCVELKRRFPDQIDWIEHSAVLHEARGKIAQAIEHYQLCLTYIDRYPEGFDSDSRAWYRDQIERLSRQSERARSS